MKILKFLVICLSVISVSGYSMMRNWPVHTQGNNYGINKDEKCVWNGQTIYCGIATETKFQINNEFNDIDIVDSTETPGWQKYRNYIGQVKSYYSGAEVPMPGQKKIKRNLDLCVGNCVNK